MRITSDAEHEQAIERIEQLMDHELGRDEAAFLDGLVDAVAAYEQVRWPIDPPDFDTWLHSDPERCGGRMVIRGTRIEPRHVHARLMSGDTLTDIAEERPDVDPMAFAVADLWHRIQSETA